MPSRQGSDLIFSDREAFKGLYKINLNAFTGRKFGRYLFVCAFATENFKLGNSHIMSECAVTHFKVTVIKMVGM